MKRLYSLFILTLLLALPVLSSSHVRHFTIHDGLPSTQISGIEQDSHGLLWLATWNGLCCYDGYQFSVFNGPLWGDADALSSLRIATIKIDSRDNIWLRTYDGGLYLYDTHQCCYFNIGRRLEEKYGVTIRPRNFYSLPNRHTWVSDELNNLNLRIDDQRSADIDYYEVFGQHGQPLQGDYIKKVEMDAKGNEWVITNQCRMHYGNRKTQPIGHEEEKSVLNEATKERLEAWGIDYHQYKNFYIDRQRNLWMSSDRGLTLVNLQESVARQLSIEAGKQIRAVLYRKDGTLWAGTQDGYVACRTHEGRQWLSPQGTLTGQKNRFSNSIYALFEDSRGLLWIGTKGDGLYTLSPRGTLCHYMPGDRYGINSTAVYDIDEDTQGRIWIATFGGGVNLAEMVDNDKGSSIRFLHKDNAFKLYPKEFFEKVRRITHTKQGTVIASTTTGLLTFRSPALKDDLSKLIFYANRQMQGDTASLRTNDVMQTLVTRQGTVYVATLGGAIQRVLSGQLLTDRLRFHTLEMNGLPGNILSLTEDSQGNLWMVCETGIECYAPHDGTLLQYGFNGLWEGIEPTEAKLAVSSDDRLWMGTIGGMATFSIGEMKKKTFCPPIVFTTVQYQGEQKIHPLLHGQQISITTMDQRYLTISFAALDYPENNLIQYAYRLDDGEQWNYIGRSPRIAFSNLPPGVHRLAVKSTDSQGAWADNVTELTIDVQPMLWERGWFQLCMLLLVVAVTTWMVLNYLRRRQLNEEREQRLEHIMRQYRELSEQLRNHEQEEENRQPADEYKYKLSEPEINDPDEEMMTTLMAYIEQHLDDDGLRIEDMAEAVNMGRTVFYEKIRQLVGVSPSDFLKQVRMQRARQLIAKSKMTFSQIAYSVGFTDPKYFTKCFKKETGMTPSEYREKESATP